MSAGRCNHAGTARASGPIPAGDGNTMLIGWEIDYNGVDQEKTAAQYNASIAATAAVLKQLGKDASYARGHRETSTTGKIDPSFIDLNVMRSDVAAKMSGGTAWSTIVDNTTAGRFTASANWGTSTYSSQRYGADYRFADPIAASDAAWYKVNIPATGTYRVDAWWPANAGYNSSTPYVIAASVSAGGRAAPAWSSPTPSGSPGSPDPSTAGAGTRPGGRAGEPARPVTASLRELLPSLLAGALPRLPAPGLLLLGGTLGPHPLVVGGVADPLLGGAGHLLSLALRLVGEAHLDSLCSGGSGGPTPLPAPHARLPGPETRAMSAKRRCSDLVDGAISPTWRAHRLRHPRRLGVIGEAGAG
ncbi:golvesin C-terminal-like domain-containing protein [Micromonospora olivasterospora]|uniref:golvesin C-terminal-like domain-containing protein n=1 Tax=Micromonospora olivasterospora TaxID=1880 RepID=UPI003CD0C05B